jgi:protease I
MLNRRLVLLALCSSALACTVSPLPASTPSPTGSSAEVEEPRVRAVVDRYLHGLKFNDVASLRSAFAPDAKLLWVRRDGTMGQLSQADWYKGFAANAGKEEEGDLSINSVDITGDVAAVKVVETYPKEVYVDYLNLVRAGGEWRIVNKVYTRWAR